MMARWGLDGMRSFEQVSVAKKEGTRIEQRIVDVSAPCPQEDQRRT